MQSIPSDQTPIHPLHTQTINLFAALLLSLKNFQIAEATLTGPRFNTYFCQFNVFLDPNILCKQV